jgi:CHAT domain-containing protein
MGRAGVCSTPPMKRGGGRESRCRARRHPPRQRDVSETTVKRTALVDYRVVYFATHGLVAGDVVGLAEPSLALTLPKQPTEFDDGLLTASEVAQLKLNADWVVLSACNTAAGDRPGAEALSGLVRAFFYAGARALLVSHWSVDSEAAARLTTSTFALMKSDPKLGRAAALRNAVLAYMNDKSDPLNAYPAFWGPFPSLEKGQRDDGETAQRKSRSD